MNDWFFVLMCVTFNGTLIEYQCEKRNIECNRIEAELTDANEIRKKTN
jgi:hypothetical protein